MNKLLIRNLSIFSFLFLTSCNLMPFNRSVLELSLDYRYEIYKSFEDVSAVVFLRNVGNRNLLVNRRLSFSAYGDFPRGYIEGTFLITDSSGNIISTSGRINKGPPRAVFFGSLPPGKFTQRSVTLHNLGFLPDAFKINELYTVIVIYQNSLDVMQIISGQEVAAWKGEARSNADTFMIVP